MSAKPNKDKKVVQKPYDKKVGLNTTFNDAIQLLAASANKKSQQRQQSNKK